MLVFYGKWSKIKTRKQHFSPVSCFFFVFCTANDGARSVLKIGVDDRLQTMKGVRMLHPVVVGIIIHPFMVCFVLFSFSHLVHAIFSTSLFSYSLFGSANPPSPLLCPSSFPSLSLSPVCFGLVICWNLQVSHLSAILLLSVLPPFFNQHLPFPYSANLSPWNLSNSSCTHSIVPLIACSFTLPFLPFLAVSALAAWQLLAHTLLSSYHQLTEVCKSVCVCKCECMFVNNSKSVYVGKCVSLFAIFYLYWGVQLLCSVKQYKQCVRQISIILGVCMVLLLQCIFSKQYGFKWYWKSATPLLPLPNIPGV